MAPPEPEAPANVLSSLLPAELEVKTQLKMVALWAPASTVERGKCIGSHEAVLDHHFSIRKSYCMP